VIAKQNVSTDAMASTMLAEHGIAVIWDTHIAAAAAYGLGQFGLAAWLTEIAEAAEEKVIRREERARGRRR
jgi:hypothetical protein